MGHGAPRWGKVEKSWFFIAVDAGVLGARMVLGGKRAMRKRGIIRKCPSVGLKSFLNFFVWS